MKIISDLLLVPYLQVIPNHEGCLTSKTVLDLELLYEL